MKIPEFDFDSPPRPIGYAHDTRGRATPGLKDMLAPVLTRHLAPFTAPTSPDGEVARANEDIGATAVRLGIGAFELLSLPANFLDAAIATLTAPLGAALELAAATLATPHLGIPHCHTHPPAMPTPLASFGPVLLGNCLSVLISGFPAARAGDFGIAVSCGTLAPPFQIVTGSSKVFIGGARAARIFDLTTHCQPAKKVEPAPTLLKGVTGALASQFGGVVSVVQGVVAHKQEKKVAAHYAEEAAAAAATATDGSARSQARGLRAMSHAHALASTVQAAQAAMNAVALGAAMLMGKDPGVTPCVGMLLSGDRQVLIGGLPLPPSKEILTGLRKSLTAIVRNGGVIANFRLLRANVLAPGRTANARSRAQSSFTGHPVDVVTGRLVIDACDLELPGALPLRFERAYSSSWSERDSPLGRGWSHSLDEAVWQEPHQLVYRAEDGRELELPCTDDECFIASERLTLRRLAGDRWQIENHHGVRRDFAPVPGDPHPGRARLVQRRDRQGHVLRCSHDDRGRLIAVHADGDREIRLHYHPDGHLAQIDLPDPDGPGFVPHVRYRYVGDDLAEIHDALGQVTRYGHDRHRITEEQLPGAPRFHFQYDGDEYDAPCVRTWGDGGIIDHRLVFDRARQVTVVTNACKETTLYRADPRGLVVEICGPDGASTRFTYDEHLRRVETRDPLGHATRDAFDARGNCVRHEGPDGAVTTHIHDGRLDLPVARTDPAGGQWRWSHDPQGRLLRATDPLGRSTVHHHDMSHESGRSTVTTVHPDGRSERRAYDPAGRLIRVDLSDGTSFIAHSHDRRGRLRRSVDDRGRVETRDYDLLDRLTRHALPDGEVRHYSHDASGQVVRACDPRSDLRCSYTGLGWLTSCGHGHAAPITLERDLEGRLLRVAGPNGTLLRLERDPAGRVRTAIDALGVQRRFTRDPLGRVTEVLRPDGLRTRFTRDPAGRIVAIEHIGPDAHAPRPTSHPTAQRGAPRDSVPATAPPRDLFTYRPDGALLSATRHHPDGQVTVVRRELDAVARVVREHQDEHTIACEYDLRDRVTRLRSSLDADLRFVHDDRGLARLELPQRTWAIEFERDRDGREQARHLPGDVLSWWQRDALGRPSEHGVIATSPPQIHRQRRYHWTPERRLHAVEDTAPPRRRPPIPAPLPSPTQIHHDAEGRRVAADLSDGTSWSYRWTPAGELAAARTSRTTVEYRHDALGRRIARVQDGAVTRWVWHGDVPLHELGDDTVTWVFEPDGFAPLARLGAASRHAVVGDHLGVPLTLFDERGQLAWSADFDARGQLRPTRGEPTLCPMRFPGQLADPATGLAFNRFREYDPATGRYLTPDPLGLLGSLDPYAYVADPRTQSDVFGLTADRPAPLDAHARIAAEVAQDFPRGDLPPALVDVQRPKIIVNDYSHLVLAALLSQIRRTC